jgi:hypothetical protein
VHGNENEDDLDWEIPAMERGLLNTVFVLRTPFTVARSIKRFEAISNEVFQIANRHDVDFLSRPTRIPRLMGMNAEDCEWTILMVIDHLTKHNDFVFKSILSLISEDRNFESSQTWHHLFPIDANLDCLDRYQESVWHNVSVVSNLLQSGKFRSASGSVTHPVYGFLNARKLLHFASFYSGIRKRQIQKIMAVEGVV